MPFESHAEERRLNGILTVSVRSSREEENFVNQVTPSTGRLDVTFRQATTTMTRQRGGVVVQIQGVPTYQDEESGEVMIPGPLAVRLDHAMLAVLDAIEQDGGVPSGGRAAT